MRACRFGAAALSFLTAVGAVVASQPLPQQVDEGPPRLPAPVATHGNRVEPVFGMKPYVDRLLVDIAAAERSVYVNCYVLGGEHGLRIAEALGRRHADGLDVRLLLDRHLGTGGKFRKEAKVVARRLDELGVPWRRSRTRSGSGLRQRVVDHNKLAVIDAQVAYVGGTNVSDTWARYNDLMMRVQGPAAGAVHQQHRFDWALAGDPDRDLPEVDLEYRGQGLPASGSPAGLSTVTLVGTGPGRRSFEGALLNALRSAQTSIEVQVHQLHHDGALDELIRAHQRGVAVRVFLDPTNIDNLVPLIRKGPRGVFNAYAVTRLREAGVPVRFVKVGETFDAFHMKLGLFDGRVLLVGTANWDRRAANVLSETVLEISGGPAVTQVRRWFDGNWESRGVEPSVGYFAQVANWLMRMFL